MPSITVSNPRDLVALLLGELLFVERRLHDAILPAIVDQVADEELRELLHAHQQETRAHVERVEEAFRRVGIGATSNLSRTIEAAAEQHSALASSIVDPRLADLFHAQAALHGEQWELAAYRTLLPLVGDEASELLKQSYAEEGNAAKLLVKAIDRLSSVD
jgi:ferritin-like metal-binding protein YciE